MAGAPQVRPTLLGKLTTALQFLALFVLVLHGEVVDWAFVPAAVVSVLAALDYLLRPLLSKGKGDAPA